MSQELPPLYRSSRLTMLVKRWINTQRIKLKEYLAKTKEYLASYKLLLSELVAQPRNFEFNNRSIDAVIKEFFKI